MNPSDEHPEHARTAREDGCDRASDVRVVDAPLPGVDLAERIQRIATRLTAARDEKEALAVVLEGGASALELRNAALWHVRDGHLELARSVGYSPSFVRAFARVPLDSTLPVACSARAGKAEFYSSRDDYAHRHPEAERGTRPDGAPAVAFACLPLVVQTDVTGLIAFAWPQEHVFSEDERRFLLLLATQCAHALERTKLVASLRSTGETLDAVVSACPAAVMLLDLDGTVRLWNPAAARIFGWSADEVLGRFLPAVGDAQRDDFLANLACIARGDAIHGVETVRMRRDGPFEAQVWGVPVLRDGALVQCLSMVLDIGERKRMERMRALVTEAGRLLAGSLDYGETLRKLAQ